jgi:hypothetical protein
LAATDNVIRLTIELVIESTHINHGLPSSAEMPHIRKILSVLLVSLSLASCGNQPKYGDAKKWLPELLPGDGRLFVYRPSNIFTSLSPFTLVLNWLEVGDFYSGTGFYLDVKSGRHEESYNGGKGKLFLEVPEGGSVYLKYKVVADNVDTSNFVVTQMAAGAAKKEMDDLLLIEAEIPTVRRIQLRF